MPSETSKAARDRNLQIVTQHMAKLEVNGLPRNYELFHEALSGTDPALSREVLALSALPSQAVLDEIGLRHQVSSFVALTTPRSRDHEIRLLTELRDKMSSGVTQKQGFTRVLEAVARSLREDNNAGPSDILAEIEYLSVSLSDAVVAETELEEILKSGVARLVKAESDIAAARTLTMRDRLTSLPNHAAFAERLEKLYGAEGGQRDVALFLVTLSDLPEITQTYGETAGNRIIKKAAAIFRKAIKKNDFLARTGKSDFAFLLRDVDRDSVQAIADRLSASIADNLVFAVSDRSSTGLQLSIGVALTAEAFSPPQLRLQAATALEAALANPRQPVVVFSEAARRAS